MIEFIDVHKSYRLKGQEAPALHPFNLKIKAGEVFGIIGHSGAGKSTLLRLINLLERPSGGHILIDGEDITAADPARLRQMRRGIGMIFQHFNLLATRTVADNVALPLRLAGKSSSAQIHARVQELLARVGLSAHAGKYPSELSGGQKQRVGIARALANAPSVLLCDEATSALDPQTTSSVLALLAELNRDLKLTIVLITHEMDVVRRVCDRVAVLDSGHIVEQGPVAQVFLHPGHATTRQMVSEAHGQGAEAFDADYLELGGRLLRLSFHGASTWSPVLSRIARAHQVDFTILDGRIDKIKQTPYGQLTVTVQGDEADAAIAALRHAGIHFEELHS
ncbi:methionine ABC transporter ATP-binding protein [Frateuria aurantia]